MTKYLLPIDIKKGDVVWVKWQKQGYSSVNHDPQAIPSVVQRIYDDGNILHQQDSYDDIAFAFVRDIIAKSTDKFTRQMRYRMISIATITEALRRAENL